MDPVISEEFKNGCSTGNLEIVQKLFSRVEDGINLLEMRNLTVEYGHLNILKFFFENNININELFGYVNPFITYPAHGICHDNSRTRELL